MRGNRKNAVIESKGIRQGPGCALIRADLQPVGAAHIYVAVVRSDGDFPGAEAFRIPSGRGRIGNLAPGVAAVGAAPDASTVVCPKIRADRYQHNIGICRKVRYGISGKLRQRIHVMPRGASIAAAKQASRFRGNQNDVVVSWIDGDRVGTPAILDVRLEFGNRSANEDVVGESGNGSNHDRGERNARKRSGASIGCFHSPRPAAESCTRRRNANA